MQVTNEEAKARFWLGALTAYGRDSESATATAAAVAHASRRSAEAIRPRVPLRAAVHTRVQRAAHSLYRRLADNSQSAAVSRAVLLP